MICPECRRTTQDQAAFCGSCGAPLVSRPAEVALAPDPDITITDGSVPALVVPPGPGWPGGFRFAEPCFGALASQFPATPGDQHVPAEMVGQQPEVAAGPAHDFRIDLRRLSRAEQIAGAASMIVLVALFLPWFGSAGLGASATVSGTTAHSYLVLVVITALLLMGILLLRSGWDEFPVSVPVPPELVLLAGAGVQLALVLAGFLEVPLSGLGWEIGAYLALIAAVAAAATLVLEALQLWQARHGRPAGRTVHRQRQ